MAMTREEFVRNMTSLIKCDRTSNRIYTTLEIEIPIIEDLICDYGQLIIDTMGCHDADDDIYEYFWDTLHSETALDKLDELYDVMTENR